MEVEEFASYREWSMSGSDPKLDLSSFKPSQLDVKQQKDTYDSFLLEFDKSILSLQIKEMKWRIWARSCFSWVFFGFLFLQNLAVFGLVYLAYTQNMLEKLAIILGVLVSGTLVESAVIVRVIVQWIFQDKDYKLYGNNKA